MAAGAESGFAHERVWAVEAVGQCEFMAVVDHDRGSVCRNVTVFSNLEMSMDNTVTFEYNPPFISCG